MPAPRDVSPANHRNRVRYPPMGFGDLLDSAFSLYRKQFRIYFGLIALHFFSSILEYVLKRFLPNIPLKAYVSELICMPFGLLSIGGILVATASLYFGEPLSRRDTFKRALDRFWQLCGSYVPWSFGFEGLMVALVMCVIFPLAWLHPEPQMSPEPFGLLMAFGSLVRGSFSIPGLSMDGGGILVDLLPVVVLMGIRWWVWLILLVLLPVGIYFFARWMFVPVIVVLGSHFRRRCFQQSQALMRGRWWHTMARLVGFSMLNYALVYILENTLGCLLLVLRVSGDIPAMDMIQWLLVRVGAPDAPREFYTILSWGSRVARSLIFPLYFIGMTLVYFDLRRRKERQDL